MNNNDYFEYVFYLVYYGIGLGKLFHLSKSSGLKRAIMSQFDSDTDNADVFPY